MYFAIGPVISVERKKKQASEKREQQKRIQQM